jgi:hypothetical protein
VVFEFAAYPYLDDFTLWNNDGPIMVEIELFGVSAVQGRAFGGANDGDEEFCASKLARGSGRHAGPVETQVGVETGVIVSFKARTFKQAPTLLVSQEMAS